VSAQTCAPVAFTQDRSRISHCQNHEKIGDTRLHCEPIKLAFEYRADFLHRSFQLISKCRDGSKMIGL
jgi:hypothetical protein